MLTTATPGAQLLSIVSRGASPSNDAPYPVDVGTATTGAATSPATTLGQRPVHPGHHDDHPRRAQHVQPAQHPVQPGHPDVHDQVGGAAEVPGGEQGLAGDRVVGGAGGDHDDPAADGVRRVGRPGQQAAVGGVQRRRAARASTAAACAAVARVNSVAAPCSRRAAAISPTCSGVLPGQ